MFLEKMVNLKKRRVEIEYLQKKLGQNVIATHGLRYAICILGKKTKKLSSNIWNSGLPTSSIFERYSERAGENKFWI